MSHMSTSGKHSAQAQHPGDYLSDTADFDDSKPLRVKNEEILSFHAVTAHGRDHFIAQKLAEKTLI